MSSPPQLESPLVPPRQRISPSRTYYRALGLSTWGFVMYRCTYDNDAAWNAFLQNFHESAHETIREAGDNETFTWDQLEWTIMEDKDRFNHASTATIRNAFQEWVDQSTPASEQPGMKSGFDLKSSGYARYSFCIQVDEESLRSLVPSAFSIAAADNDDSDESVDGQLADSSPVALQEDAAREANSDEDVKWTGFVNLIKRRWPPRDFLPADVREALEREELEEYEDEEDEEEQEEEVEDEEDISSIEGCTDHDVGFMRLRLYKTYPAAFVCLSEGSDWHILYQRPPTIVGAYE